MPSDAGARPAGGPADAARPRVLRARSGTLALIASGAVALVLLGDALLRAGVVETLRLAPWVLLAVWGVYVLVYASHIAFDARGVTVQNYLRITRVSWRDVEDIALRWQVVFTVVGGDTVTAYGGPVVGRPGRADRRDADSGDQRGAGERRSSAAVPTALREFADLRDAWARAEAHTPLSGDVRPGVARVWDVRALLALGIVVLVGIASVLSTTSGG